MSDDRNWNAKPKTKLLTLTEYIRGVATVSGPNPELELLIRAYGMETIERILAGETFNQVTKPKEETP